MHSHSQLQHSQETAFLKHSVSSSSQLAVRCSNAGTTARTTLPTNHALPILLTISMCVLRTWKRESFTQLCLTTNWKSCFPTTKPKHFLGMGWTETPNIYQGARQLWNTSDWGQDPSSESEGLNELFGFHNCFSKSSRISWFVASLAFLEQLCSIHVQVWKIFHSQFLL